MVNTALVITDPQNDFLYLDGASQHIARRNLKLHVRGRLRPKGWSRPRTLLQGL
jgi:hypothetical protein